MAGLNPARGAMAGLQSGLLIPVAALVGLVLAALGAVSPRSDPAPAETAALVNGVPLARADHERIIEALAAGKRNSLDTEDLNYALQRLIEEELLIQRGIELGLHRSEPMVRKRLVTAMLEWIAADAGGNSPSEDDLRKFYMENRTLFTQAARIDVDWFHISRAAPDGEERAQDAAARLQAGEPFEAVAAAASHSPLALPRGLLPPAKLQDYLGPSLTRMAISLKTGRATGPVARSDGWHFLIVRDREDPPAPTFGSIRAQVEDEYRRHLADRAVRQYLNWLRARADIVITGNGRE